MLRTSGTRQMPKPKSELFFSQQKMGNSRNGDSPQQVSSVSAGETSAGRTSLPSYCNFYTEYPVEEEEPSWSLFEGEWHQDTRKCSLRMKQEYLDHLGQASKALTASQNKPLAGLYGASPEALKWTGEYSSMIEYSASPEVSQWTGQYSDPYEYSVSPKMTRLGWWTESDAPGKPDFKWFLEYTPE
ncbi:hypothetical protein LB506_005295 [Fusarium annulatum]|nr:hypothetical protein LB506_005295 [Fusarium annulatum]